MSDIRELSERLRREAGVGPDCPAFADDPIPAGVGEERCPKCKLPKQTVRRSSEGWCMETDSHSCLTRQLAAYRALLVEAHELLAEWAIGWPGTRHVADLRTRIEAVVGKEGEDALLVELPGVWLSDGDKNEPRIARMHPDGHVETFIGERQVGKWADMPVFLQHHEYVRGMKVDVPKPKEADDDTP